MDISYQTGAIITDPRGIEHEIVGIRQLQDQSGVRLVVRRVGGTWLQTTTLLFRPGDAQPEPLRDGAGPYNWLTIGANPMACEIRAHDTVPPTPKRGRPGYSTAEGEFQPGSLSIASVELIGDELIRIVANDQGEYHPGRRVYVRHPIETLLQTGTRPARQQRPMPHPDRWTGPYKSPITGALFIFQDRAARRPAKHEAVYDETLPPLYDPETGDAIPYYVLRPPNKTKQQYNMVDPGVLSETALRDPIAQRLLEEVQEVARAYARPSQPAPEGRRSGDA